MLLDTIDFVYQFGKFQGQISAGYTNNVPLAVSQEKIKINYHTIFADRG